MRRLLTNLRRNRSGSAMVEFAIGSGVLVAAFTGSFQFGYTFYRYNNLVAAVNAGARYASVAPFDSDTSNSCTASTAFKNAVKNVVVFGDPTGGTTPILPGLAVGNVTVTPSCTNSIPTSVTVNIDSYSIDAVFATMSCNGKPRITFPYQGIYSPP